MPSAVKNIGTMSHQIWAAASFRTRLSPRLTLHHHHHRHGHNSIPSVKDGEIVVVIFPFTLPNSQYSAKQLWFICPVKSFLWWFGHSGWVLECGKRGREWASNISILIISYMYLFLLGGQTADMFERSLKDAAIEECDVFPTPSSGVWSSLEEDVVTPYPYI